MPLPATWLNQERWEDELPPAYQPTHASQVTANLPIADAAPRSTIPPHVQAMLDKLRAKKSPQ
jgi:hypothetical protein